MKSFTLKGKWKFYLRKKSKANFNKMSIFFVYNTILMMFT